MEPMNNDEAGRPTERTTIAKYVTGTGAEWLAARLKLLKAERNIRWLDRAPKGRNETGVWWRRHDEYDNQPRNITNS
jgi:predicted dithiol-disulfide oxidoreductase (DUF899 family)